MPKTDEEIEQLIKDYSRTIATIISGYHTRSDGIYVEDLAQEVYIRIWKTYKSDGHDIGAFYSYLRKIINSVFINEIKKRIKDKKILTKASFVAPLYNLPEENNIDQNEKMRSILGGMLDEINDPQRKVIKLRLAGLSLENIARLNKWSEAKTRNIFYRGMNNVKQLIRKRGIEYED